MRSGIWAAATAAAVGLVTVRRRWVLVTVRGVSMAPAFGPGDRILVRRALASELRRGHVVVLEAPEPAGAPSGDGLAGRRWYLKRVVALPGDCVPAEVAAPLGLAAGSRVPGGRLVALGDSPHSTDSRHWGYVRGDSVLGVVALRLFSGRACPAR